MFSLHNYIENRHGIKSDDLKYQSVYMILSSLLIIAATYGVFAVLDLTWLAKYQLHGVWTWPLLLFLGHLACLAVLFDFHIHSNFRRTALSTVMVCSGMLILYLWLHGRNYGAPMFYFTIPPMAFILLGWRKGGFVSALVMLAVLLATEFTLSKQPVTQDDGILVVSFLSVGILLNLITYFYESSRQFAIESAEAKKREIEAANGVLAARNEEQERFMAMLSHELRTPLSVVRLAIGSSQAMSDSTRRHVKQAVRDMDALVERCLQADRLQQGRHVPIVQACNLKDLLLELGAASQSPERMQIESQTATDTTQDVQLLRVALSNLIDNAIKYSSPASLVRVSVRPEPSGGSAGFLVAVCNEAGSAGMPDPQQVFSKYYRSPGAHSKTGSGLGLYLVHSVAERLGGWARYAPAGSTVCFEFWLPG